MLKKYFYKSIISYVLIISTILMPLSFLSIPKEAEAQYNIAGYTRGLAPAIARLPQCGGTALGAVKGLFNGIGDLFSGGTGGSVEDGFDETQADTQAALSDSEQDHADAAATAETLDSKATTKMIQVVSSPGAAETNKLLKQVVDENKKLNKTTQEINDQSSCIASIGRLIVKMLLQKLTVSTVMWINSGYDGKPSFLTNPGKFWKDIADTQILQFGIEIKDNPYAKDWLRSQALAYKTKFAENAQYSLNDLIQQTNPDYSAKTFQTDFSLGGWDAWTAMTQVPANNPLGAKLMFDNELQKRLAGTSQSTAEQVHEALSQANGFLGDERCISATTGQINYSITKSEYEAYLKETPPVKLCSAWTYVTPGKMVADAATTVMGYPNNSLLNVQDLNDAVAAVSDAILNQFSTNIYEKGFSNMDYQGIDGVLVFSGANSEKYKSQTQKDYIPSQLSSSWLQANPEFNIRTDLTQALIDEQRTYSDKLALQNKELMSTIDGKAYNLEECPDGWTGTYPDCKGPAISNNSSSSPLFNWINLINSVTSETCPSSWSGTYPTCTATGLALLRGSCPPGWTPTPAWPTCTAPSKGDTTSVGVNKGCPSGWTGTYPNCKGPGGSKPGQSNAYGLMPAIYQLDYCIPGPHPGWENDSRETLGAKLNSLTPVEEKPPNTAGNIANGAIGVGLNFVPYVGPLLSGVFGALTGDDEIKRRDTNARCDNTSKFFELTGFSFQCPYMVAKDTEDTNMLTREGLFYVLNSVLDRYINIMNKTFFSNPEILPTISKEAEKEFNQLPGYNQIIKDNKNKMLEIKTTVSILGDIKNAVDYLNTEYKNSETGQFKSGKSETDYEDALKVQINAFGRLSASMVNGDDIATADDLAKQIVLKKDYIYKNLLKGPYGCEADLKKLDNVSPIVKNFPSAGPGVKQTAEDWSNFNINSVKRMTYPFPILYDYNKLSKGGSIPDPWTDCSVSVDKRPESCSNTMPAENKYDKYGPGFLSFVYFSTTYASGNGGGDFAGSERLQLGGLIYNYDSGGGGGEHVFDWVTLGRSGNIPRDANAGGHGHDDVQRGDGLFEKTIGVY